jgi:hypothetical protein
MLQAMQEPAATSPSPATFGFASLLASLTASAAESTPAWGDDALADDVASLSYEQALRTHARLRSNQAGGTAPSQDNGCGDLRLQPSHPDPPNSAMEATVPPSGPDRNAAAEPSLALDSAVLEQSRRAASITIRLSKAESAQLRARAAQAGLSISAYLRSCIFEAETLRMQVREALAQFRSAPATDVTKATAMKRSFPPAWLSRFLSHWFSNPHGAHP